LDYGKIYDFNQTFTENFKALMLEVPRHSVGNRNEENSSYCNHTSNCKNCYLIFGSAGSTDSMYGNRILESDMTFDSYNINHSQYVYNSLDIYHSTSIFHSVDLENCSFCYGCVGLRNKSFCIYNQQYSREEYLTRFPQLTFDNTKLPLTNYIRKIPIGEDIFQSMFVLHSKQVLFSKDIYDCEDMKYCYDCYNHCEDCMDCYSMYGALSLSYECSSS
jgi:hypothetical protein